MWDFVSFRHFINEEISKDEIFFYLHQRNIMFSGPELQFQSATFDVVTYVRLEKAISIAEKQFNNSDFTTTTQFLKIREILTNKSVKKGKHQMIDAYFALRIYLEFYTKEKALMIRKLRKKFEGHSSIKTANFGEELTLTFDQFWTFMKSTTNALSHCEIISLFRMGFSFGNGSFSFSAFMAAASESNLFSKILVIDNTVFALPQTQEQKIIQSADFLYNNDISLEILRKERDIFYDLYDNSSKIGTEGWSLEIKKMLDFGDSGDEIMKSQNSVYNKDAIIWMSTRLISLIKAVTVHRNVIESSKLKNQGMNLRKKSKELRDFLLGLFNFFVDNYDQGWTKEELDKEWIGKVFVKFQTRIRKNIQDKKIKFFQENFRLMKDAEQRKLVSLRNDRDRSLKKNFTTVGL